MTHWIRYGQDGRTGFGTLNDQTINVYTGDMFVDPIPTGDTLPLEGVRVLPPTLAGKMLALWNNSRAVAEKMNQSEPS